MKLAEKLDMNVSELDLAMRITNRLEEVGINTVESLLQKRPEQILQIRQIGLRGLEEIYTALSKIGFHRQAVRPDKVGGIVEVLACN